MSFQILLGGDKIALLDIVNHLDLLLIFHANFKRIIKEKDSILRKNALDLKIIRKEKCVFLGTIYKITLITEVFMNYK